jgi:hypothetical protein
VRKGGAIGRGGREEGEMREKKGGGRRKEGREGSREEKVTD